MFPNCAIPTFGSNQIAGLTAPIGGCPGVGDGGYIIASELTNVGQYGGGTRAATWLIDVERWRIVSSYGETALAAGGMMGATLSRRTGYAHVWEADVVLDLRAQPALFLQYTLDLELLFRLPAPSAFVAVAPRYWWLPRAHLDQSATILDAAGKKRVRARIAGTATCHLFLLPEQGDPQDGGATRAGAYKEWLGRNRT